MTRITDARLPKEQARQPQSRRPALGKRDRAQMPQLSGPRLLRALAAIVLLTLLSLMLLDWEVGAIRIQNSSAADLAALQATLRPFLGAPLLLVDADAMAARLRQDRWVRRVRVRRQPPQTIVLSVEEAEPLFRLADGGAIDVRGLRLPPRPNVDLSALPLFECKRYGDAQRAQVLALRQALSEVPWSLGTGLARVVLDARGVTLHSADGVEILVGNSEHAARLLRLAQARPRLAPNSGDRLDLRFANQIVQTHAGSDVRGG